MTFPLRVALCLGMLALCLAIPKEREVRWCAKSKSEMNKCKDLKQTCTNKDITFSCVEKSNTDECLTAIKDNKADAITLDGGDVFKGSLHPYDLKPVMAEHYGAETETCYYAVAVVKKSSTFMFNDLKNKKSCHTGIRKTAGWNIIIGALLEKKLLEWAGPDQESIEKAVSRFFTASCVPGATEPNLCQLCIGTEKNKCSRSNSEPYYNYEGAFRCLKDGKGDVAFVKHSTVPKALYADYELLCPDNTRKPINKYKECNLAIVPAHGVVARSHDDKAKDIIEFLETAQKTKECKLFSSDHGKDLLFKDSADHLVTLPPAMDTFLFLGPKYYNAIKYLKDGPALEKSAPSKTKVRWCTQNKGEKTKCDDWTALSGGAIVCSEPFSAEGCITQILKGEADAVALDGGYMYTAGQMGLVPVMGEYYDKDDLTPCEKRSTKTKGTYYAVAIVKKGSKITWNNLKAQKSCHTAVGRTAGWNIPMGLIANKTNSCEFDTFFQEGCAPGAKPNSNLCKLCIGDPSKTLNKAKCSDSGSEGYYGYSGAFRCLVEKGDVCFAKHTTVFENTDGKNPADWAKNLKSTNFELLCPDGSRASVSDYKTCNLAEVPAHAVVTRPQIRKEVVNVLSNQQSLYGRKGMEKDMFQMFVSNGGKDLLFKDSTQCLLEIPEGTTMEAFLGDQYNTAVTHLNKCSKSALLTAWEFHTCS